MDVRGAEWVAGGAVPPRVSHPPRGELCPWCPLSAYSVVPNTEHMSPSGELVRIKRCACAEYAQYTEYTGCTLSAAQGASVARAHPDGRAGAGAPGEDAGGEGCANRAPMDEDGEAGGGRAGG